MEFSSHGVTGPESRRWGWLPLLWTGRRDGGLVAAALLLLPILLASTGMLPLPGFVERGTGQLIPGRTAEVPSTGRPSPVARSADTAVRQTRSSAVEPNADSVIPVDPASRRRAVPSASDGVAERLGPAAGTGSGSDSGSASGSEDEGHRSTPSAGPTGVGNAVPPTVTVSGSESGISSNAQPGGVDVAASASLSETAEVSGGLALPEDDSPVVEANASVDASAGQASVSTSASVAGQPVGVTLDVGQGTASIAAALPANALKVTLLGGDTGAP